MTLKCCFLLSFYVHHLTTPQIYFAIPWGSPDSQVGNHLSNIFRPKPTCDIAISLIFVFIAK